MIAETKEKGETNVLSQTNTNSYDQLAKNIFGINVQRNKVRMHKIILINLQQ